MRKSGSWVGPPEYLNLAPRSGADFASNSYISAAWFGSRMYDAAWYAWSERLCRAERHRREWRVERECWWESSFWSRALPLTRNNYNGGGEGRRVIDTTYRRYCLHCIV